MAVLNIVPQPQESTVFEGKVQADITVFKSIDDSMNSEEYILEINADCINITAGDKKGLYHADATLRQIRYQCGDELPLLKIVDSPVFEYRSFHIDCARHFFAIDDLKKMIEAAALFKFNYFHWHFSDDQGWRIVSNRFPLLHKIGSVRNGDHFGDCRDDTPEGGYYTQDEVRELVSFCAERGMEIVPEVDIPGHVTAILAAYPEYSCAGEHTEVLNTAGITKLILCAGKEKTYKFIYDLIDELMELFPGQYFHIGGDEVPKHNWTACPDCQSRIKAEGLGGIAQLQGYFTNRIGDYLRSNGRTVIAWNEASNGENLSKETVTQFWLDLKGFSMKHTNKGGRMINSRCLNCYCDYPYGLLPLKKAYSLHTIPGKLSDEARGRVIGVECLIWTEYIRTFTELSSLAWPRFAATAELGWCGDCHRKYMDFKKRIQCLTPMLENLGIVLQPYNNWDPLLLSRIKQVRAFFRRNFNKANRKQFTTVSDVLKNQ